MGSRHPGFDCQAPSSYRHRCEMDTFSFPDSNLWPVEAKENQVGVLTTMRKIIDEYGQLVNPRNTVNIVPPYRSMPLNSGKQVGRETGSLPFT